MNSVGSAIKILILGVGVGIPTGYLVGLVHGTERQLKRSREHRERWEKAQVYVAKEELYLRGLKVKENSAGLLEPISFARRMPRADDPAIPVFVFQHETMKEPRLFKQGFPATELKALLESSHKDWNYKLSSYDRAGGTLSHKTKPVTVILGGLTSRTTFYVGVDNVGGSLEYEEWEKLRDLADSIRRKAISDEDEVIKERALQRLRDK